MKKILLTILASATTFGAFAQEAATQTSTTDSKVLDTLIAVVVIIAIVAMIAHMIYEHFRGNLNTEYTVDYFRNLRKESASRDMTAAEVDDYNQRIDQVLSTWDEIYDEDGEAIPYPFKRSAVMNMWRLSKEITAANPTDSQLVARVNGINEILNHALKRQFSGSKAMVIVAIIMAVIMGLIADSVAPAITVGIGILLYLLASRSATFLIAKKEAKGRGNRSFLSGIIGGLFMGIATAKTYKTVTTYSDGSTTTETDNSDTWISMIFAFIVMLILAAFLAVISVINYIRNYLIYW